MSSGPLALLVDTWSLFFRAHHALPPMNTKSGEPTSALYGFSAALLEQLVKRGPLELAFAVDAPQPTFRHERMPAYKAHRDATPPALSAQLGRLRELLAAFGAPVFEVPGVEADDVLATLAVRLSARAAPALVMTGDRDLFQTAAPYVQILFVGARGRKPAIYDARAVEERFGTLPAQLPALTALVGDASDNLPRVPGVGPRTAAKWIRDYGSAAALLARLDELEPARLRPVLEERREQILESERLATVRRDVPLGDGPLVASVSREALARVHGVFEKLEFRSFERRLAIIAGRLASGSG